MSETSVTPAELVASALAAHPWNSYPKAAHRDHGFDSGCAVCKGDVEALANVAVYALADADALAGARLVVVPACACGHQISACRSCGEPRCYYCDPGLGKHYQPMKCNERHEPARAALPERIPDA